MAALDFLLLLYYIIIFCSCHNRSQIVQYEIQNSDEKLQISQTTLLPTMYHKLLYCGLCIINYFIADYVSSTTLLLTMYHQLLYCGLCIINYCIADYVSSTTLLRTMYHQLLYCGLCIINYFIAD